MAKSVSIDPNKSPRVHLDNKNDNPAETEAEAYVESIMSSQRVTRVDTPVDSGRKRNRSEPGGHSNTKKPRTTATARRALYSNHPIPAPRNGLSPADARVPADGSQSVEQLIGNLSADMHKLFSSLSDRVEKLESSLEQKIANKVAQLLDKRVTSEMNRIRKDVDKHVEAVKESIRDEVQSELHNMSTKLETLETRCTSRDTVSTDIGLNIVIRGLPESENENIENKVNAIIKDGLKVFDTTCSRAERKVSNVPSKPGLVIAKMKSLDDKKKLMSKKSVLKSHRQYSKVFIHHDQSKEERAVANSFRTIISSLKCNDLAVRGSRVVRVEANDGNDRQSGADNFQDRGSSYARAAAGSNRRGSHDDQHDGFRTVGRGNRGRYNNTRGRNFGGHNRRQQ